MSWSSIIAVAIGGAIGAVGRYLVAIGAGHWLGTGFPAGTLIVNVVGSFAMGVLVEVMALAWSVSSELRALLVVGLLGAFTTFSTFSLDVAYLYERGQLVLCAVYILASFVLCVAAVFAGLHLTRLAYTPGS